MPGTGKVISSNNDEIQSVDAQHHTGNHSNNREQDLSFSSDRKVNGQQTDDNVRTSFLHNRIWSDDVPILTSATPTAITRQLPCEKTTNNITAAARKRFAIVKTTGIWNRCRPMKMDENAEDSRVYERDSPSTTTLVLTAI